MTAAMSTEDADDRRSRPQFPITDRTPYVEGAGVWYVFALLAAVLLLIAGYNGIGRSPMWTLLLPGCLLILLMITSLIRSLTVPDPMRAPVDQFDSRANQVDARLTANSGEPTIDFRIQHSRLLILPFFLSLLRSGPFLLGTALISKSSALAIGFGIFLSVVVLVSAATCAVKPTVFLVFGEDLIEAVSARPFGKAWRWRRVCLRDAKITISRRGRQMAVADRSHRGIVVPLELVRGPATLARDCVRVARENGSLQLVLE